MTAPWMRKVSWTSVSVWNKLYKKSGIKKQFNESCLMCEDLRFNLDYIEFSRKMVVISSSLYFYRQHEMSIMSMYRKKQGNIENGIIYSKLLEETAKGYSGQNSEMVNYLDARAAYSAHGALWRIFAQKKEKEFQAYVSEGRALIRRNYVKIWKDKSTYGIRIRAGIGLFNYCFPLWCTAVRIYEWYANRK